MNIAKEEKIKNQSYDKVNILGTHVSCFDLSETIKFICNGIDYDRKLRVCVTPVNCLMWASRDKKLQQVYNTSDLNLADGVPLIWASKILSKPIEGRVTGLDLLPAFAKLAAGKGYSFFFLGAKEGVADKLTHVLKEKYPTINVAGTYSPPFAEKFSDEENDKMIKMINEVKPNVLWVSLTAPKQDFWIYENFDKLDVNIAIGVGGAFEVTADLIPRAPLWMQRYGLEWFYRFSQEPRRLFRRYFIEAIWFFPLVILQKFGLFQSSSCFPHLPQK